MTTLRIALAFVLLLAVPSSSQELSFYYLILQWPGSYCNTGNGCCYPSDGKPMSDFTIHSLRGAYANGVVPVNCEGPHFNLTLIADLQSDLEKYWPSMSCPNADGPEYWKHEWENFGRCSLLDQHSYFEKALQLTKQQHVLHSLEENRIKPDGGSYRKQDIEDALAAKPGSGTKRIECNTDESDNDQLYQVHACFDMLGFHSINCHVIHDYCSSETIEFPAF